MTFFSLVQLRSIWLCA